VSKILKTSVTVLFILWQVIGVLILLKNPEIVTNMYHETQQTTREFFEK
jgi:hypothetical protein